jgi:integrase
MTSSRPWRTRAYRRSATRTRLFAPEPPGRTRYLSEREEERLRTAIGDEHWPKVVVGMHTGLDRGAQFALRWEQVDLQARIIHAERRKGRRDGTTSVTVAINDELLALLRALPSRLTSPWVFPNADGTRPLDGDEFDGCVFQPALVRAGINKVTETK